MNFKFGKITAGLLAVLMSAGALTTGAAAAGDLAGRRTKPENNADTNTSYAARFASLYADVITNGETNGYLSSTNKASGGFGVPYHSIEELCVEAPDYGHLTTSEAMSYIVWIAAMNDYIATNNGYGTTGDLTKSWATLEMMIPTVQDYFWGGEPSAQYADEFEVPEKYPAPGDSNNTATDPLYSQWKNYGTSEGLYLVHWLADVDDWYGYGGSSPGQKGKFTFINTFQRGEQESVFETVPHPSVEELKYGNSRGIIGIFSAESQPAAQWRYTNAPDAEDRAVQAAYFANRYDVGNSSVSAKAGKMKDQVRSNMFDKYYIKIGAQSKTAKGSGYESCHYLMSWYTSWGGSLEDGGYGGWRWKIGCSHVHYFYQNPLAAYGILYDNDIKSGVASANASAVQKDYEMSIIRQLEFFQWLQSPQGLFAGGATNSFNGRYEQYPSGAATFYDMIYTYAPVYVDPPSNNWIGNQVWATQRLAELYYYTKSDSYALSSQVHDMLESVLPAWVTFFVENCKWDEDAASATDVVGADYAIPSAVEWTGQPDTWTGSKSSNSGLSCSITGYTSSDIGCVASLANTLIWYAAAVGTDDALGGQAYDTAKKLLDRAWNFNRDDLGIAGIERNGSLSRIFTQEVYIPSSYSGTMPNGDKLENGATFASIRSNYKLNERFQNLEAHYNANGSTDSFEYYLHRFWHAGDYLMALGTMSILFPDAVPDVDSDVDPDPETTWGDVHIDGVVDGKDLVKLAQAISKLTSLKEQEALNADVQYDSTIDGKDLVKLSQYLSKMIDYSELGA